MKKFYVIELLLSLPIYSLIYFWNGVFCPFFQRIKYNINPIMMSDSLFCLLKHVLLILRLEF